MFPSNSNGIDPISIWDGLTILHKPLSSDAIPNSKQADHLVPLFNIPSPFLHYYQDDSSFLDDLDLLLPQPQQPVSSDDAAVVANNTLTSMVDLNSSVNANETSAGGGGGNLKKKHSTPDLGPRKRTSKKDRHSKIYTARGPRDRRMRLSLEVARDFFDLQDMLGFDKASKTVEWLLLHSKSAIKELSGGFTKMNNSCTAGSASSTSECDVASGIDEAAGNGDHSASVTQEKPPIKEKKTRQSRRNSFYLLARESRKKARERARERTEKLWMRRLDGPKPCGEAMKTNLNKRSSLCETCEESGNQGSNNVKAASDFLAQSEEPQEKNLGTTGQIVDDSLAIMGRWSPTFSFNNLASTGISQEVSFEKYLFHSQNTN